VAVTGHTGRGLVLDWGSWLALGALGRRLAALRAHSAPALPAVRRTYCCVLCTISCTTPYFILFI
jgi:hypothetical protein